MRGEKNTFGRDKLQRVQTSSLKPCSLSSWSAGLFCYTHPWPLDPIPFPGYWAQNDQFSLVLGSWASSDGHNSASSSGKERGHTPLPVPFPAWLWGRRLSFGKGISSLHSRLKNQNTLPVKKSTVFVQLVATSPHDPGVMKGEILLPETPEV